MIGTPSPRLSRKYWRLDSTADESTGHRDNMLVRSSGKTVSPKWTIRHLPYSHQGMFERISVFGKAAASSSMSIRVTGLFVKLRKCNFVRFFNGVISENISRKVLMCEHMCARIGDGRTRSTPCLAYERRCQDHFKYSCDEKCLLNMSI